MANGPIVLLSSSQTQGFQAGSILQMLSTLAAADTRVVTLDSPPSNSARSKRKMNDIINILYCSKRHFGQGILYSWFTRVLLFVILGATIKRKIFFLGPQNSKLVKNQRKEQLQSCSRVKGLFRLKEKITDEN